MFFNRLRVLLALLLVLILTCSFSLLANAEEESADVSDITEDISEVSGDVSEESKDESEESEESEESPDPSEDEDDEDEQSPAGTPEDDDKTSWTGRIIAGGIILAVALGMFIAVRNKTPFGLKLVKFVKDYRSEIKKVVWLSRKETFKQTGVVLITLLIAAVFLGLLDYGFTQLVGLIG